MKFVYFGGEPLGVPVLDELKIADLVPDLIVCNPDRLVGRKQALTAPPVKTWANKEEVPVIQPDSYKDQPSLSKLTSTDWDLFVVVAYNFILPNWILEIPQHGVLNVHPSLLPKLRGASPIRTAIKEGLRDEIGVTIMKMDKDMDHGPILDQIFVPIADENWPPYGPDLDQKLAAAGGALLADTIPSWIEGQIVPQPQEHQFATYCHKLTKTDSELTIDPNNLPSGKEALNTLQKIRAFSGIGDTFFVYKRNRVKIKEARLTSVGKLEITQVIPEGKNEISFIDYLKNL